MIGPAIVNLQSHIMTHLDNDFLSCLPCIIDNNDWEKGRAMNITSFEIMENAPYNSISKFVHMYSI